MTFFFFFFFFCSSTFFQQGAPPLSRPWIRPCAVLIKNCNFLGNEFHNSTAVGSLIVVSLETLNASVIFQDCVFRQNNRMKSLVSVASTGHNNFFTNSCGDSIIIYIINSGFISNTCPLFYITGSTPQETSPCMANVYFHGLVYIYGTTSNHEFGKINVVHIRNAVVHLNGKIIFEENYNIDSILDFDFCDVYFHKNITFNKNVNFNKIVNLKSNNDIKIMKHAYITFVGNVCQNQLITIDTDDYKKVYPFCLFQYVGTANKLSWSLYKIIF